MAVTASAIKSRWAADFGTLTDGVVEAALAEAARRMSASAWAELYDDGLQYLAAHILRQDQLASGAAPGPVVSRSLMGASVTYALADGGSELGATPYGRRFKELSGLVFAPRVV